MMIFILYAILSTIIINIIGKIILSIFDFEKNNQYYRLFIEQVIGTTSIVTFYSLYKTNGITINLLFLFVVCFFFGFVTKVKIHSPKLSPNWIKNLINDYFVLLLITTPIFFFKFSNLFSFYEYIIPHIDSFYYSEVSNVLNLTGNENRNFSLNILYPLKFGGVQPYHYFEIWLNSFFIELFHTSSIYSLLLITYPCLMTIVFVGFLSIWETIYEINIWAFLCVLIFLFLDGNFFAFNQILPFMNNYSTWSSVFSTFSQKSPPVFMFIILFMLLYIKNNTKTAFFILSCSLIVNPLLIPGIGFGVLFYLFLNSYHKTFIKKDNIKIIIFYVVFLFSIGFFYFLFGDKSNISYIELVKSMVLKLSNINNSKYILGMMLYRLFRTFILFLPYIITYLILLKTNKTPVKINKLISLLILVSIIGLISYGLIVETLDSAQLFTNTITFSTSFIICFYIYSFVEYLKNKNAIKNIIYISCFLVILICSVLSLVNNLHFNSTEIKKQYSNTYITSVLSEIQNKPFVLFAALYPQNGQRFHSVSKLGRFVLFSYGYRDVININNYSLFENTANLDKYSLPILLKSEFYLFTKGQKLNGKFLSYEKSQIDFVDKYKISYVFAGKNVYVSDLIKRKIKRKIIDPYSGEQFYVINH